MRKKLFFVILLITSLLLLPPLSSVNANEDKLNIFLEVNIDDANNVNILFFMGTGSPKDRGLKPTQIGKWNTTWDNWGLRFENTTTQGRFEEYAVSKLNTSADDFVKNVLGIKGEITVNSIQTANYSDGICIKMNAKILDTTLHPLSFLGTEYEDKKIDEVVNIKIKIISKNAMLNTPISEFILFHYRLPTGEYMEYSSDTNTINVNTNPFFSPLGSFIVLIAFAVMGIAICIYARKYMRGVRLGPEIWVLSAIFYFCAFIPLSIYLVYVFMILGLVFAIARLLKAMRTAKPKVKPRKVSPTISGDAVEKYLGKEKMKEEPVKVDEEAEKAYRELHKYSEITTMPREKTAKKEKEEKTDTGYWKKGKEEAESLPKTWKGGKKIDIESLLKIGREKKVEEEEKKTDAESLLKKEKREKREVKSLLKTWKEKKIGKKVDVESLLKTGKKEKGETSGEVMEKESRDDLMKLMEKKGFKKKEEKE